MRLAVQRISYLLLRKVTDRFGTQEERKDEGWARLGTAVFPAAFGLVGFLVSPTPRSLTCRSRPGRTKSQDSAEALLRCCASESPVVSTSVAGSRCGLHRYFIRFDGAWWDFTKHGYSRILGSMAAKMMIQVMP